MEEYQSGHTGAVLKTACLQGHGGSNPSSSAMIFWRHIQSDRRYNVETIDAL